MSPRTNLLPVMDNARRIVDSFGLRTNDIQITVRTWPSGRVGEDDYTDGTSLQLVNPRPRIREISSRDIASSGGQYKEGDLRVDKLTPAYSTSAGSGGYTPEQLDPRLAFTEASDNNREVLYQVTGPNAGEYRLISLGTDRAFGYVLVIRCDLRSP